MSTTGKKNRLEHGYEAFRKATSKLPPSVEEDFEWVPVMGNFSGRTQGREAFLAWLKPDIFEEQRIEDAAPHGLSSRRLSRSGILTGPWQPPPRPPESANY